MSIQCTDLVASAAFYDVVLEPLGAQRIMDFGNAIGYGVPPRPDFWIGAQATGDGFRESHIAFSAPSRAAVRAFFDVAVAEGATVLHEPRLWPEYHATYFGAFVRDPDGNNIEAVCHLTELPVHSTAGMVRGEASLDEWFKGPGDADGRLAGCPAGIACAGWRSGRGSQGRRGRWAARYWPRPYHRGVFVKVFGFVKA